MPTCKRFGVVEVGVCAALALAMFLGFAAPASADPLKCQRSILKDSLKFAEKKMKALSKCEEKVVTGNLPQVTNCHTEPSTALKISKAESKLRASMDKNCGGDDKSCGTGGDDDTPGSIDWPTTCPDFEGLGCTNGISDCDDIGECLVCVNEEAVDQAIALSYDDLQTTDPDTQADLNKCQRAIGKENAKYQKTVNKALRTCWDKRLKNEHSNPCPNPGDGKAADKIAKAGSKHRSKICKACGGADQACGGSDDLSVAAIGFATSCPNVAGCGTSSIDFLQDIINCSECVEDFKASCESALAVPAETSYPAGCAITPPPIVCGDGSVQIPEECDDGGTMNGDGCSSTCQLESTNPALCAGVPTSAGTSLDAVRIASGYEAPVHIAAPRLDPSRIFVVEQPGRIQLIKNGVQLGTAFLDIEGLVQYGGEEGLLSVAFHPDYETNRRFFVYYVNNSGDLVIARYEATFGNFDDADESTAHVVLTIPHPGQSNHNGGNLNFGPDGFLYAATGDGVGGGDPSENSQNDLSMLGKLLRIDPDTDAVTTWAKGLRNPFRFSFDRANGDIYIGDVGQGSWEEIDYSAGNPSGVNYGWDDMEGRHCYEPGTGCLTAGRTLPVLEYCNSGFSDAGCANFQPEKGQAVTGGFVYRGCAMPDVQGRYFYADFYDPFIRSFKGVSGGDAQDLQNHTSDLDPGSFDINNVSSFGEDARGELYIADYDGEIFKIVPGS